MSNRFFSRRTTSPIFGQPIRQTHPSTSQSHKISALFVTQKRAHTHESEIIETHTQLNNCIDQLDVKIQKVVQKNEAQLLYAYKNHLEFVKVEMKEFKEETMAIMDSQASHLQRIEVLEKKLIVFRDQALKLFQKTLKKDKIIESMQFKIEEHESQRRLMNETVKSLMKRNKEMEVEIRGKEREDKKMSQIFTNEEDYLGKIEVNSFVSLGISSHKKPMSRSNKTKDRVMTTSVNNSKMLTRANFATYSPSKIQKRIDSENNELFIDAQGFSLQLRAKLGYVEPKLLENIIHSAGQLYESIIDRRYKAIKRMKTRQEQPRRIGSSLRNRSFFTSEPNSKMRKQSSKLSHKSTYENSSDSQLKDCFRNCVEVVKKEIARRRKVRSINFFNDGCPISLQSFNKLDFMKLLELLLANQRTIQALYNSLFLSTS